MEFNECILDQLKQKEIKKMNKKAVVIVESPAKASTIERYLGSEFTVLASYGHVRDLVHKSGSVDPEHDFSMIWGPTERSQKHIDEILKAVKKSDKLFLATDPDREGEAIAWHISELIKQEYGDKTPAIQRVVFHEITKNVISKAIEEPRYLDKLLVNAYLARRALDYLVGYSLSPILWQKLPGARSAGRVQSVALRMIVEREQDIEKFKSQEYWSINGAFETSNKELVTSRLIIYTGKKLAKFDISAEKEAQQICKTLQKLNYFVSTIEKKQVRRFPAPPFTTSTLQQEASRKLGFGASRTMRTAQKLYEGILINGELTGLITYMRTDSVNLSKEALKDIRKYINDVYGNNYLPREERLYKTKTKNAQEAHEAIRPTSILRRPEDVNTFLDADQQALYGLIWKRAIASQMENAIFDQVTTEISDSSYQHVFKAVGTTQVFDGFLHVYQEGRDEEDIEDENTKLPVLQKDDLLSLSKIIPEQHFTQPPPRFTEASLVKNLEELGIGRPSTYAPLMQVLQDREYVSLEKRQFIPSNRGRIVTAFLTNFCRKYVEYDFTAQMEEELDNIANGLIDWKKVMKDFWKDFSQALTQMKDIRVTEVIDKLEEDLSNYLFKNDEERKCTKCETGHLGLKLSKFGAFLGCSNYPECQNRLSLNRNGNESPQNIFEPLDLGIDSEDNSKVSLRKGPYGFYIQIDFSQENSSLAEASPRPKARKKKIASVKRIGLPSYMDPSTLTLKVALQLKSLPKIIGSYENKDIQLNTGRFGPYVKWENLLTSVPKSIDFLTLTEKDAILLIKEKLEKPMKTKKIPIKKGIRKKVSKAKSTTQIKKESLFKSKK